MNTWKCTVKDCSGCTLLTPDNLPTDEGWRKECLDGQLCRCSEWRMLNDKEVKEILSTIKGLEA